MKKPFEKILVLFFALAILGAIIIFGTLLKFRMEIVDLKELVEDYKPAIPTVIYDRNDKIIDEFYTESREPVSIEEVPEYLKNAFLAIEDKKFYEHNGIHLKRFMGAMIANLKKGKLSQGGSSITQQLAKNAFLSSERKISRKIKELIIAFEMERTYTKDEILERYLNEIYFGSGSYGVSSAAERFFKKNISELNLAESALLAGIPNRPSKYNPIKHLDNALSRQKIILKEMYKDGKISDEEYEKALEYKFVIEKSSEEIREQNLKDTSIIYVQNIYKFYKNPELTEMIEEELEEIFSEEKVYTGGLKIYTTFDLDYQEVAKEIFENYYFLKNNKSINGAMVTLDPFTGGIISMVGGKKFKAKNFNRATMAKRQYGSSFKPFLYLTALSYGIEPYSVITDDFISYGNWEPKNNSGKYSGNTTLVNATNLSINIPAIKILEKIGVKNFEEKTKDLKYSGKITNLTAALGSMEGTPLNLAENYSIFVNGGNLIKPNAIREIKDNNDVLIYITEVKAKKVFKSNDVNVITSILQSVVKNGTAGRARVYDEFKNQIQQGGKTGTTNEHRTIWYAGITPDYVTVCYMGKDDNKPMLGEIYGGSIVAPLWAQYYQTLIEKKIYVPTKFKFLENHLEVGDLMKENLDIKTGLIDGINSCEIIVRKGRIQVEKADKYKHGVVSIFGLDSHIYSGELIDKNKLENKFKKEINVDFEDKLDLIERLLDE